jgi:hypothetical protein
VFFVSFVVKMGDWVGVDKKITNNKITLKEAK